MFDNYKADWKYARMCWRLIDYEEYEREMRHVW